VSSNLARLQQDHRALAVAAPIEEFRLLDKYAGGLSDLPERVPWLATISAGYLVTEKNGKEVERPYPAASRKTDERWIHMTPEDAERAPGLYAALESSGFRWLDVAVPFDDPNVFIQQHFERRTATKLEVYGDEHQLTEIKANERRVFPAGTREYAALVRDCNVSVSFFFTLAKWEGRAPRVYFPATDGLGVYRLRFTSRNSLRELVASLRQVSALTGGRLAGLPLRLGPDWRQVADPTGARREIVVWRLRFMPPERLELTPAIWQGLARAALAEGELLRLPAPTVESIEDAVRVVDVDLDESSERAVHALRDGPPCDARFYQQAWFARVRGSALDSDAARAEFISRYTDGTFDSLSAYLAQATEEQAATLLAAAGGAVGSRLTAEGARRYEEIFGDDRDRAPQSHPLAEAPSGREESAPRRPDPATGEVLGNVRPPTRAELWADNRRLGDRARELGLHGVPVLVNTAADDVLLEANRALSERIVNLELDQELAAEKPKKGTVH
jgi:hypothetical protein